MPELPEVETFKRYFDRNALNRKIISVGIVDTRLLEGGQRPGDLTDLEGRIFTGSKRHGKYLFLETSGLKYLTLHFGMTGYLRYFNKYSSVPSHTRLLLGFGGSLLAFVNTRRLGKLSINDSMEGFIEKKNLGPDALEITRKDFANSISGRKKPVKSALMDQSIVAGVGNLYADEILFQSRVHPLSPCSTLNGSSYHRIYDNMKNILNTAIKNHAIIGDYPAAWLLPHRRKKGLCPHCRKQLYTIRISGRSSYFCPDLKNP